MQTYEKTILAKCDTPLSDACRVANMVVYIMSYELLDKIYGETKYFNDMWNERLTDEDLADMLALAKKWFGENPNGLQEIWV